MSELAEGARLEIVCAVYSSTEGSVVGQAHVTRTLSHSIEAGRVAHAIIFSGPRGTGKTTVARILAKAMNCEKGPTPTPCNTCRSCLEIAADSAADVFEIDGASNNSVDQVRELRDNVVFMPSTSRYKIYIIDEVHMLSLSAFNALLKTLEEPPAHVLFMFATTEIRKIPITILSRCQRHDMRRIDHTAICDHLATLCEKEAVEIPAESLALIARQADGSMRDALSLLDQVMAGANGAVAHELVLDILGGVDRSTLSGLSEALLLADVGEMFKKVGEIYQNGQNLQQVYIDLLAYLRDLTVIKRSKSPAKLIDRPKIEIDAMARQVEKISETHLANIFELLYREEATVRHSLHPRMAMEMVLLKLGYAKPVLPIDTLIEKLDQLKSTFAQAPRPVSTEGPGDNPLPEKATPTKPQSPPTSSLPQPAEPTKIPPKTGDTEQNPDTIWKKICQEMGETSPSLAASLTNSRLIVKDHHRLTIDINGGDFNLELVRLKKNQARIERMLQTYFGSEIVVTTRGDTTSNKQRDARKQRSEKLQKQALEHPMVNDALEIFNGQIEKVNIIQEEDQ